MSFIPALVCWRCGIRDNSPGDEANIAVRYVLAGKFPASYSSALLSGSHELDAAEFLGRVQRFECIGSVIDSFSGFCDTCMRITLHTAVLQGPDQTSESKLLFSLHYLQNQMLEMEKLEKFSLLLP